MKALVVVYIALVVLALSACQKPHSSDATAPGMNAECVSNPNLCQSTIYNTPGYSPYNYGGGPYTNSYPGYDPHAGGYYGGTAFNYYQNNSAYLCNCASGSIPTYNGYAGLGCVQQNQVSGYGYAYFSWGASNNQWTNIPQISNQTGYTNSGCYNGVVQSCLVDQPNTCSVGYSCRSNDASSRLGLCVSSSTANSGGYGPAVR